MAERARPGSDRAGSVERSAFLRRRLGGREAPRPRVPHRLDHGDVRPAMRESLRHEAARDAATGDLGVDHESHDASPFYRSLPALKYGFGVFAESSSRTAINICSD